MAEQRPGFGISNRENPQDEERERREHPPQVEGEAADAQGADGQAEEQGTSELQTSGKSGVKATAQKQDGTRHTDGAAPSTSKVQGAFGKES